MPIVNASRHDHNHGRDEEKFQRLPDYQYQMDTLTPMPAGGARYGGERARFAEPV